MATQVSQWEKLANKFELKVVDTQEATPLPLHSFPMERE